MRKQCRYRFLGELCTGRGPRGKLAAVCCCRDVMNKLRAVTVSGFTLGSSMGSPAYFTRITKDSM